MLRLLAALFALLPGLALADITGIAEVIDGDTLEIHGHAQPLADRLFRPGQLSRGVSKRSTKWQ